MLTALILIALAIYLLPTIVGALLRVRGLFVIFLVNVFLGWTIAGWVVALMWVFQRTGIADGDVRRVEPKDRRYFEPHSRGA